MVNIFDVFDVTPSRNTFPKGVGMLYVAMRVFYRKHWYKARGPRLAIPAERGARGLGLARSLRTLQRIAARSPLRARAPSHNPPTLLEFSYEPLQIMCT